MSRRHRMAALAALTLVFAASRFSAIAKSPWDWDEALFALSVLDYDVAAHQPHPPGYPLFVGLAKVVHAAGVHEFRALQAIATAGAMLLFPLVYLLARELGYRVRSAVAGAALFAVLPNVWLYGGTGFSDVPSVALSMLAAALILRGRNDARAYLAGAVIAGIAAGVRSATLLVVAAPAIVATATRLRDAWRNGRRAREVTVVAVAALIGALIVFGSYLGAALASDSIENYRWAVRVQGDWVRNVDSFLSPQRPNLVEVGKLFFVLPVQDKDLMFPLAGLALLGAIQAFARRRTHAILTIATFGPLMVFSWLMLDLNSVSRYAIAYLPMHALLAAEALDFIAEPFSRWRRWLPPALYAAAAVGGVLAVAAWIWPSLRVQRKKPAPPFAAVEWVRANVPDSAVVYVPRTYEPHARYLLRGRRYTVFSDSRVLEAAPPHAFIVEERVRPGAINFERRKERLWKTVRARYFESSVRSVSNVPRFGSGWYQEEWEGTTWFRWMGQRASVFLPVVAQPAVLTIAFSVPDAAPKPVLVTALFNGRVIEEFPVSTHSAQRRWTLESAPSGENELQLVTSATLVPAAAGINPDRRPLGLRLEAIEWMPHRP